MKPSDNKTRQFNDRIVAKKSKGQNFLVDASIINRIVENAVKDCDAIIEIGPGTGALTQGLLDSEKPVYAIEIDLDLQNVLLTKFGGKKNFNLTMCDVLALDLSVFFKENNLLDKRVNVVSNLPYYITSPILFKLYRAHYLPIHSLTLMMQKEVGERINAERNNKNYSAFSVVSQFYCDINLLCNVKKESFRPIPKVDSQVLNFTFNLKYHMDDEQRFIDFVRQMFANKRKTILNNLAVILGGVKRNSEIILESKGFDLNLRAENLGLIDFYRIYREVYNNASN